MVKPSKKFDKKVILKKLWRWVEVNVLLSLIPSIFHLFMLIFGNPGYNFKDFWVGILSISFTLCATLFIDVEEARAVRPSNGLDTIRKVIMWFSFLLAMLYMFMCVAYLYDGIPNNLINTDNFAMSSLIISVGVFIGGFIVQFGLVLQEQKKDSVEV